MGRERASVMLGDGCEGQAQSAWSAWSRWREVRERRAWGLGGKSVEAVLRASATGDQCAATNGRSTLLYRLCQLHPGRRSGLCTPPARTDDVGRGEPAGDLGGEVLAVPPAAFGRLVHGDLVPAAELELVRRLRLVVVLDLGGRVLCEEGGGCELWR